MLTQFFSNAINNVSTPEFRGEDNFADKILYPILKPIFSNIKTSVWI